MSSGVDYCQIALAQNPSGAPANFANPPSLITAVQAVGITLGVIALVLISLRLYVRVRNKTALGLDDGTYLPP